MDVLDRYDINGMLNTGANVFGGKIGVVIANDLGERQPFTDKLKHVLHRDPRAGDAGLAEMNLSVNGDATVHGEVLENQGRYPTLIVVYGRVNLLDRHGDFRPCIRSMKAIVSQDR